MPPERSTCRSSASPRPAVPVWRRARRACSRASCRPRRCAQGWAIPRRVPRGFATPLEFRSHIVLESKSESVYSDAVKLVARLFCVLALVAFAAGGFAHAAGSAVIGSAMVAQDAGMTGEAGCDACEDMKAGSSLLACQFVCSAGSLVALQAPSPVATSQTGIGLHYAKTVSNLLGISGPPFTQPPRFFI